MPNNTHISWTDKSSNPIQAWVDGKRGWFCVHASTGCLNCYAERMNRFRGNGLLYRAQDAARVEWRLSTKELLSWSKLKPGTLVFPFDMTDFFYEGIPNEMRVKCFEAMLKSPATFQVLTKRAKFAQAFFNDHAASNDVPRNIWVGVSAEDVRRADERMIPIATSVFWVSAEPLLEAVDFTQTLRPDWIVVGGESGRGARPFDLEWARKIIRYGQEHHVPVFVKQLGDNQMDRDLVWGYKQVSYGGPKGGDWDTWPEDLRVREFPEVPER